MQTIIIAEIGECFNGNMNTAKSLMNIAKIAGCDIVKYQILDIDEVAEDDPERKWFEKIAITPSMIHTFVEWAKALEIELLFTPVSIKTARWLVDEGLTSVKIASSFVTKQELLDYINMNFQTVYASTGMASIGEIEVMLQRLDRVRDIRLLHCISEYPTGPLLEQRGLVAMDEEDAHLNMMAVLRDKFPGHMIGYSDHTDGIFVPLVAVCMGAEIIEKHITMDRSIPIEHFHRKLDYMGTDHVVSIEPNMLSTLVSQIRRIEKVKGSMKWERSKGERILMEFLKSRYRNRQ